MTDTAIAVPAATPEQAAAAAEAEARLQQLLALGDVSQANAATAIYGDSGTGKSTLCATAAEYCWNRYHKITRYVAADLGGFGNKLLRLAKLGIVQVYSPGNHIEPFETMENLSKGYWPAQVDDKFTGQADPNVRLLPPQTTRYNVYCQHDHLVKSVGVKAALNGFSIQCPICKGTPITTTTWGRVEEVVTRDPWIQHVGLYVYDSGTALDEWAMEDMADRAAKNDPSVKDGNALSGTGARILSGEYAFGANTQQHYGFAQGAIRRWIKNSRHIPGQVVPPLWTFLELRATDDSKNIAVYGPKVAGNALTPLLPAMVGNCINVTKGINAKGNPSHQLWLVNHTDPGQSIAHLAKTRAEPGTLPAMLEDLEGEAPLTKFSMGYFFDRLEDALHQGGRQDALDYPDAPLFIPLKVDEPQVVSTKDLGGGQLGIRAVSQRVMPTANAVTASAPAGRPSVVAAPLVAGQVAGAAAPRPQLSKPPAVPAAPVVAATAPKPQGAPPITAPGAATVSATLPVVGTTVQAAPGGPPRPPRPPAVPPGQPRMSAPPPPGPKPPVK